jgi:hypothetical protein
MAARITLGRRTFRIIVTILSGISPTSPMPNRVFAKIFKVSVKEKPTLPTDMEKKNTAKNSSKAKVPASNL